MSETANPYAAPTAQLTSGYKRCESCGAAILVKAEICPKCGVRQRQAVSKTALLLLTFFTGGIGGHKFYLKKNWQGVLYLLFFWTYIPGIIALIEFIIYACTSSERLNEKYEASSAGVVIAIVVAIFFIIAMIGILAAIALPAYQDYTLRARTATALQASSAWRVAVEEHFAEKRRLPSSAAELGATAPPADAQFGKVSLGPNGVITVTMSGDRELEGKTIVLTPTPGGAMLQWDCTAGTLPARYRPSACRQR